MKGGTPMRKINFKDSKVQSTKEWLTGDKRNKIIIRARPQKVYNC